MSVILLIFYSLALAFIFFYSLVQLNLVYIYLHRKKEEEEFAMGRGSDEWPMVTIQLPVYNERYVVERLIEAVASFDYPEERLEVQVLDDSDDDTTEIIKNKIRQTGKKYIHLVRRPEREGYKAGALKYGLEIAKGEYIAIFDADFMPHKDFLKRTVAHFEKNEKIGVVQTRWEHINRNYSLLTKLQAFGLDAHFTIEQTGRNQGGHFINFNGTGGVWRKSCILEAGNWQSDTLTEDLDLSYRAQMKGWKFIFLEDVDAPAELPATMNALKSQQFRWTKGAAENAKKNLIAVLKTNVPLQTKIHSFFHLLNSTIFVSILLSAVLSIPVLWVKNIYPEMEAVFQMASFFMVSFFILALYYFISFIRLQGKSWKNILRFIITFPLFLSLSMGLSLHNSIAVLEGYLGFKTPFIRTPKFNITESTDSWRSNLYLTGKVSSLTIAEGFLALYFLFGLALAFYLQDFGLFVFHSMLTFGFASVCFYSYLHSRT